MSVTALTALNTENAKRICSIPQLQLSGAKDDSKLFFQLIDSGYERNSTIITTNINFGQWDEIFGDALIANAIIDRLLHHATIVTIKGKSYRLQNLFREMEAES